MPQDIIDIYNNILNYTHEIKAAIHEKNWERVNLLASHREELFQKTNAFVINNKDLDAQLKEKIFTILKEIKNLDDENLKSINEDKVVMQKQRIKLNIEKKALNAYQKKPFERKSTLDEST